MYGQRVLKCHPRVEAYGVVDELNSALGLVRAVASDSSLRERVFAIQRELIVLMGELAVQAEDLERYVKDGHPLVTPEMISGLETWIYELEATVAVPSGWAIPGSNPLSAWLDVGRTICRRAERRVCALQQEGLLRSREPVIYLNRLADLLWLLARRAESKP
jgi:cob(I)alamin adenosyltransferase